MVVPTQHSQNRYPYPPPETELTLPKNPVTDLITDQEMAFARLILAGTMTDRQAAEAAGLNPDTAAYTKAKPRVREYMLEHRAAVQQRLLRQEEDLAWRAEDERRRQSISRDRVLARLWEIANLSPEVTRNSISGQVKALSMIVAMEGLIPDHRATGKQSPHPLPKSPIYEAGGSLKAKANANAEASPGLVPDEDHPAPQSNLVESRSKDLGRANSYIDPIESLLAPKVNPWEKGPATSYVGIFSPSSGPNSFSIATKPINGSR
jgi:hypothetical protein